MKYDIPQRVFLVKKYYESKSITSVQRNFRTKYPKEDSPSHRTILNIVSNFEKYGSVAHVPPKRKDTDQKREEAKNQLEKLVSEIPNLSIRKAACALQISPTLVYHIFHDDLHLKPYKFHLWHKLEDKDYEKRLNFAHWFLNQPKSTIDFMVFSDEAYFYLTLPVNIQNNRQWSKGQPFLDVERTLHDKKILVWCGISVNRVFGPYYFENTINQKNYLEMLKNFFWPKLLRTAEYKKYIFQQDGARPHTATTVQTWLTEKFGNKFIDKNSWPPRSPDLNPCDFFLWGYLKSVVYNPLPKTLDDLKVNLEREIKKINKDMLKSTFSNFEKRCHLLKSANGGHIENK
jgi:AraC-like DNA-binding protein